MPCTQIIHITTLLHNYVISKLLNFQTHTVTYSTCGCCFYKRLIFMISKRRLNLIFIWKLWHFLSSLLFVVHIFLFFPLKKKESNNTKNQMFLFHLRLTKKSIMQTTKRNTIHKLPTTKTALENKKNTKKMI